MTTAGAEEGLTGSGLTIAPWVDGGVALELLELTGLDTLTGSETVFDGDSEGVDAVGEFESGLTACEDELSILDFTGAGVETPGAEMPAEGEGNASVCRVLSDPVDKTAGFVSDSDVIVGLAIALPSSAFNSPCILESADFGAASSERSGMTADAGLVSGFTMTSDDCLLTGCSLFTVSRTGKSLSVAVWPLGAGTETETGCCGNCGLGAPLPAGAPGFEVETALSTGRPVVSRTEALPPGSCLSATGEGLPPRVGTPGWVSPPLTGIVCLDVILSLSLPRCGPT